MRSILSRYVASLFAQSLALFTFGLLSLAILIDFAVIMRQLLSLNVESPVAFVLRYYAVKIPFVLPFLIPASMLMAATFTLTRLAKTNELVPILMGGRSLPRACLPFVAGALLAGVGTAALDEFVLPVMAKEASVMQLRVLRSGKSDWVETPIRDGYRLSAQAFDWPTLTGEKFRITVLDEAGRFRRMYTAARARWIEKHHGWKLSLGTIEEFENGMPKLKINPDGAQVAVFEGFGEDGPLVAMGEPADFRDLDEDYFDGFRTMADTRRLMARNPLSYKYQAQYYQRFAAPFSPLVLILLGLPLIGVLRARQSAFLGGGLCLVVVLAYFGAVMLGQGIASQGEVAAVAGPFAPVALFGITGAFLFLRMRT